jgi:hypothetical protein
MDDGIPGMPLRLPQCEWTTFDYEVTIVDTVIELLYVNVWFDFNRDGDWDDVLPVCAQHPVPEWAVRNQMLLGLLPDVHLITSLPFLSWHPPDGPESIWMRITLSEQPWTGGSDPGMTGNGGSGPSHQYYVGETEDYNFVPDRGCLRCPDLNCDGIADFKDLAIFASLWLKGCP